MCVWVNFVNTCLIAKCTRKTYLTLIYVKDMYYLRTKRFRCLLMVRIDVNVDWEPVFLTVVYISIKTNVARDAFRAATTISQYMTSVEQSLLWTNCF